MESKKYELNKEDAKKIGKGAFIATAGALLIYVLEVVPQVDFGSYTPIAVAIASVVANSIRKYIADLSDK